MDTLAMQRADEHENPGNSPKLTGHPDFRTTGHRSARPHDRSHGAVVRVTPGRKSRTVVMAGPIPATGTKRGYSALEWGNMINALIATGDEWEEMNIGGPFRLAEGYDISATARVWNTARMIDVVVRVGNNRVVATMPVETAADLRAELDLAIATVDGRTAMQS